LSAPEIDHLEWDGWSYSSAYLERMRVIDDEFLRLERLSAQEDSSDGGAFLPESIVEAAIEKVADFVKQKMPLYIKMKPLEEYFGGQPDDSRWHATTKRILHLYRGGSRQVQTTPPEISIWDAVLRCMAQHRMKRESRGTKLTAAALEDLLRKNIEKGYLSIAKPDSWGFSARKSKKKKKKKALEERSWAKWPPEV
jgi:hypothetical protein